MPIILQEATPSDLDRLIKIQFLAFGESYFNQILFPGKVTPDAHSKAVERARKDMKDPCTKFMKAVDTDLNDEIVGFAKWLIYKSERPESEWMHMEKREWGEGVNAPALNEFIGMVHETRMKNMGGKPHCCMYVDWAR